MIPRTAQPLAMWRAIGAAEARTARIRDAVTRDGDPSTACQDAIAAIVDVAVLAGVDLGWDASTILAGRYAAALEREVARAISEDRLRAERDELRDVAETLMATVEEIEQELDAANVARDDARAEADRIGDRAALLEEQAAAWLPFAAVGVLTRMAASAPVQLRNDLATLINRWLPADASDEAAAVACEIVNGEFGEVQS